MFALMAILALPVVAQTNTPPQDAKQFYQTAMDWVTKFNPDLDGSFTNNHGQLYMGVDNLQGSAANLADDIGISYKIWKSISLESNTRTTGIAGTILSEGFGFGLNFPIHDAQLTLYAEGVANLYKGVATSDRFCGEIGLRLQKALTTRTFAYIGIAAQLPKNAQVFSAGAGFTF